ncbi:hypothetical protein LN650_01725 [Klebsiella pneumoniae subsp. pneumoniae]|nr:hypothetical protein [Klebsiella pneumoniae subsp. pneumoniae]
MPINTGSIWTCCSFWLSVTQFGGHGVNCLGRPTRLRMSPNCRLALLLATSSTPARLSREITTS